MGTYIQVLWEDVKNDDSDLMNGAVEAIHTLCGIILFINIILKNLIILFDKAYKKK